MLIMTRMSSTSLMHCSDLYCVKMILDRLSDEEECKKNWFQTVKCLSYATQNRPSLLRELLAYLGDYYEPLLDSNPNALVSAINNRSEECVSMLFAHIQLPDIKDQLIATKEVKSNALISCVRQNNTALVELLVSNHSDIEPLLGASFRRYVHSAEWMRIISCIDIFLFNGTVNWCTVTVV